MKRWSVSSNPIGLLVALLITFFAVPATPCPAAEVLFKSDSILRYFERDLADGSDDNKAAPGYEYLQIDAGNLSEKGLSFHIYGWGRYDFAGDDVFEDDTAGELLYGYLQYTHDFNNLALRAGRFYAFEGVANEAVDGVSLRSDITPWFTLSAYGGQPVALDSSNGRSGDSIAGGRLSHHLGSLYDIGVSYKNVRNDSTTAEEFAGVDFSLFLPANISLLGFSSYNLDSEGWGEHSYEARWYAGSVLVRPYYQLFNFGDYFTDEKTTPALFRIQSNRNDEELTVFGGDITWQPSATWDLGAKIKSLSYDERDDDAIYYAALATWHGEETSQAGGEFGISDGDSDPTSFWLARAFFYWDSMSGWLKPAFITGDVVYARYDKSVFGEDSSLFASLGAGRRFFGDALTLKISGDYSSDPFFDEDIRGMLFATYLFQNQ